MERELEKKQLEKEFHETAWKDFSSAKLLVEKKKFYDALDSLDELGSRPLKDNRLIASIKEETLRAEQAVIQGREPLLEKARELQKWIEAYDTYKKAAEADPYDQRGKLAMERIRNQWVSKARSLYSEGVFAESYGDVDVAEKRYSEVQEVVPTDDEYYLKAKLRLDRLTLLKRSGEKE